MIGTGVDMTVGLVAGIGAAGVKTLAKGASAVKTNVVAAAKWNGNKVKKVYEGAKKGFEVAAKDFSEGRVFAGEAMDSVMTWGGKQGDDMLMMMSKAKGALEKGVKAGTKAIKTGGRGVIKDWMNEAEAMQAAIDDAGGLFGALRKHHVFPQQENLARFWAKHKINMHEFIVEIDRTHHQILHGNWGYMDDMNKVWTKWVDEAMEAGSEFSKLSPEAQREAIMTQMQAMLKKYNLPVDDFKKYTGWTKFFAKYAD
jgi:hypothetical protein